MADTHATRTNTCTTGAAAETEALTVLVADDDANIRTLLKYNLERAGMSVVAATDGAEAIECLSDSISAALLDMRMPEKDGMACLQHIRENWPYLPVVIMTAHGDVANAVEAMKRGAFQYVSKPLNLDVVFMLLLQAVLASRQERLLHEAQAQREKLIVELQTALDQVKLLSGLLPICANCKRIRDDKGYWNQVEAYIGDHSEAEFTHGICPECVHILYPELCAKEPSLAEDIPEPTQDACT